MAESLGRYRLDAFLGEGGMGRVYRAFDPSLGRAVAIKILPRELIHDPDRLDRFVREARTASSLNHPNVVTIYEIGAEGDTHFIAMELLEGETLRERGKLEMRRAIEIIAQVADGVAAAHSAGVIHRDLKPENIIITKSGFAKVLDFGLAKLREATPAANDGATARKTDPGTILGSAGYMSPEQAAGRDVDHRTDIFSLGCILYEVISGRRAFAGESSIDTLHKIIHDDPPPLADLAHDLPSELQRIVRKCLAKDPDERYQSAKDLAIDLRGLKRDMESQPRGVVTHAAGGKRNPLVWIAAAVVGVLLIALVIRVMRKPPSASSGPMSVARITASGNVIGATISPNGEYVAYAYSDAGKHSLLVRQLGTGSTLELVPPSSVGMWGMTFSPDSRSVFYAVKSGTDPGGGLYEIPILGGTPRRLLSRIDSAATFSPDAKRIAFIRGNDPKPGQSAIVLANADGSGEKTLISKSPPDQFSPIFWGAPSWSPDGKLIATPLHSGHEYKLLAVDVSSGREQSLTKDRWSFLGHVSWLHDMTGIVAVGAPLERPEHQLWLVSFPDGQRKQVTNDLFEYRVVSITSDDKSLLTVAAETTSSVWLAPLTSSAPAATKLTSGKYDGLRGVAAGSDRIVFTSLDSGKWDLWSVDTQGKGRRQLTPSEGQGLFPVFSPDGRFIVFSMPRESDWQLARINVDGSDLRMLCGFVPTGTVEGSPDITPDGKWVVFQSAPDGVSRLWKVSIDGGVPSLLRGQESWRPAVSPDGKWVALVATGILSVVPLSGGGPEKTFEKVSPTNYCMMQWTPDGKALIHNCGLNDRKNLWLQPIDSSAPHQITNFDDQLILGFDVMPNGKELAVVRGVLSRDAVLIKNFR